MLSATEYMIVWAVYFVAALGMCFVWWKITKPIPWQQLRQILRVIMVMLLFTPWSLEGQAQFWAPAYMVVVLDAVGGGIDAASRAGVPLLVAQLVGLIVSFSYYSFNYSRQ